MNTVIVTGPQGCGKTSASGQLAQRYGCKSIVDEWYSGMPIVPGALHLTCDPAPAAPPGVLVVLFAATSK